MTAWSCAQTEKHKTIAFVPTMGYLHEGHLSLVERAQKEASLTVVSIYVNPTQFGPKEDFSRYPRNSKRDFNLLRKAGVDVVFAPRNLYEKNARISVNPGPMAEVLCGAFRPGHFSGVATVVLKLFNIVCPDVAVFGQKDAQQYAILQRMVKELDLPVRMVAAPTLREKDGLAMSSRNTFLSEKERAFAPTLYQALRFVKSTFVKGEKNPARALKAASKIPQGRLQYLSAVHPNTLMPVQRLCKGTLVASAMFAGKTRLIDNIIL